MFVYIDNRLGIKYSSLIEMGIISRSSLKRNLSRGQITRLQRGCNGKVAILDYDLLSHDIRRNVEDKLGFDPKEYFKSKITINW